MNLYNLKKWNLEGWSFMPDVMSVNGVEYRVIRLLGKGKGGYSYLVERDNCKYVLKQIHHEPCDYYQFGELFLK